MAWALDVKRHSKQLSFGTIDRTLPLERPLGISILSRRQPPKPTPVFDTYWRFAVERQATFFRRLSGAPGPWTSDPIIRHYRFTNAYRASDRVSQYLIQKVQYDRDRSFEECFFRTLLFKLFNKVSTWELLEHEIGEISYRDFDLEAYDACLERAISSGKRIYSAAYIMPSGGRKYPGRKHRFHLELLKAMMRDGVPHKIERARRMSECYSLLLSYDSMGPFLAYQFATDLNYCARLDFDEMEFVQPGPGARDGIRKCFADLGDLSEADTIKFMADSQEREFESLGLHFESLGGRRLQLIDCQNLFCEVDKYARVRHPEFGGISGRTKIKQRYRPDSTPQSHAYPAKWNVVGFPTA